MKQVDANKYVAAALRKASKPLGWSAAGGFAFRVQGESFFFLVLASSAKQRSLAHSLRFKPLAFDDLLWKILGMPGNASEPLSLRARGAYKLHGTELSAKTYRDLAFTEEAIHDLVLAVLSAADTRTNEVALQTSSLEKAIAFIEQEYRSLITKHPQAATTIWVEKVLFHMLAGQTAKALSIANARIVAGDRGGFVVGGESFFQCARRYIEHVV